MDVREFVFIRRVLEAFGARDLKTAIAVTARKPTYQRGTAWVDQQAGCLVYRSQKGRLYRLKTEGDVVVPWRRPGD